MATFPSDASCFPESHPNRSSGQVNCNRSIDPFFIRTFRQQDLTSLSEVLASSFHTKDGAMGWLYPLLRQGIHEDLRMRLRAQTPRYACLVAIRRMSPKEAVFESRALDSPLSQAGESDRIVGTVEIAVRNSPSLLHRRSPYPYLSNLAVLQEYRQQGVAQQLLKMCERIALDWGYHDIHLHVLENNDRARRLYDKAGYQVQQTETSLTSLVFGRSRQVLLHKALRRG